MLKIIIVLTNVRIMHYELLLDNGQNEQKRKQTSLHTGFLA
jgi:hypothetical protein